MTKIKNEKKRNLSSLNQNSENEFLDKHADLLSCISQMMTELLTQPLQPGLYLVATPIGNLGDITLRALSVISRVNCLYCEDTRHSRILLSHYKISQDLKAYHEHNAEYQRPLILSNLKANKTIGLISDAGTPLISDPGYKLVNQALAQGTKVWVIPGPSAVLAGICLSGLPQDRFLFGGFLPPRPSARQRRIEELAQVPSSLIFFEAQSRLVDALKDLEKVLGSRKAAVGRELTKLHEEVVRGSLKDLAEHFSNSQTLGEFVIIVAPPLNTEISDRDIEQSLAIALQDMRLRDAAQTISEQLSVAKSRVYNIGLKMKNIRKE